MSSTSNLCMFNPSPFISPTIFVLSNAPIAPLTVKRILFAVSSAVTLVCPSAEKIPPKNKLSVA